VNLRPALDNGVETLGLDKKRFRYAKKRGAAKPQRRVSCRHEHHKSWHLSFRRGVDSSVPLAMAWQPKNEATPPDLAERIAALATLIRQRYGPRLDWRQLLLLLEDRACVRFPCELRFDAEPLLPGEFALVVPRGLNDAEGFIIYLHPFYALELDQAVYLVLPQLVRVNYGLQAAPEDAENFGAQVMDVPTADYFHTLCQLSDQLGGDELI